MTFRKRVEGAVNELAVRLGVLHFFEFLHALVVFDAVGLHLGDLLCFEPVELAAEDEVRIFGDRFGEGEEHQRIVGRGGVHEREGIVQIERKRLVHREILLQPDVEAEMDPVRVARGEFDDLAFDQGAEELPRALEVRLLVFRRFVRAADKRLHGAAAVFVRPAQDVEQRAVGDLELRQQALGRCGDEPGKGGFVPRDVAFFGWLAPNEFFAACFAFQRQIFDNVLGSLGNDVAQIVKPFPSGAAADLVKIARAEDGGFVTVIFAEACEENRADGHVDADAEGVGAANDLEQAALGETLDEDAIFGQETGVMQADAVAQPALDLGSIRTAETVAFELPRNGGFFFAGGDREAGEILRTLGGVGLREVNHVNRAFASGDEVFHRLRERSFRILKIKRNRAKRGADGDG